MLASKSKILSSGKVPLTRVLSTSVVCQKPAKLQNKLSNTETPEKIRSKWFAPIFPVEQLKHLLDHDNHEMRDKFRDFISEPVMVPRYNISLAEERELALRRLQRICDNDFISVKDFWNNPLRIFAAHELAAIIDPAMTTKMTVQVRETTKKNLQRICLIPFQSELVGLLRNFKQNLSQFNFKKCSLKFFFLSHC